MRIVLGGRELGPEEQVAYLMNTLGWSESRARQRVKIGRGESAGDIVRPVATKPLPPDRTLSRRPINLPKFTDGSS